MKSETGGIVDAKVRCCCTGDARQYEAISPLKQSQHHRGEIATPVGQGAWHFMKDETGGVIAAKVHCTYRV